MLYRRGCKKFVKGEAYFIDEKSNDPNGPRTLTGMCVCFFLFYFCFWGGGGGGHRPSKLPGRIRLGTSE